MLSCQPSQCSGQGGHGTLTKLRERFERICREARRQEPHRVVCLMLCTDMSANDLPDYKACDYELVDQCSKHWGPGTRPRLWWSSHQKQLLDRLNRVAIVQPSQTATNIQEIIPLSRTRAKLTQILEPGWKCVAARVGQPEATFSSSCLTTAPRRKLPLPSPRGTSGCDDAALRRWKEDGFARSPFQYMAESPVVKSASPPRSLLAVEEERRHGF